MRLQEIHTKYNTDKGTRHLYLQTYDSLFQNIRNDTKSVLEIGTLFGGSLKLWNEYFPNAIIHGIEDFSQGVGFGSPVNKDEIIKDLSNYPRINLHVFDSTDVEKINTELSGLSFDIIVDDACHSLDNQSRNIKNFINKLSNKGIYVIEDVQSQSDAQELQRLIKEVTGKDSKLIELNVNLISDDRLIIYEV